MSGANATPLGRLGGGGLPGPPSSRGNSSLLLRPSYLQDQLEDNSRHNNSSSNSHTSLSSSSRKREFEYSDGNNEYSAGE